MSTQEDFLRYLVEEEKVSPSELIKKFGLISALVMILGWYDKWSASRKRRSNINEHNASDRLM